jgi:hypothetical protein
MKTMISYHLKDCQERLRKLELLLEDFLWEPDQEDWVKKQIDRLKDELSELSRAGEPLR